RARASPRPPRPPTNGSPQLQLEPLAFARRQPSLGDDENERPPGRHPESVSRFKREAIHLRLPPCPRGWRWPRPNEHAELRCEANASRRGSAEEGPSDRQDAAMGRDLRTIEPAGSCGTQTERADRKRRR